MAVKYTYTKATVENDVIKFCYYSNSVDNILCGETVYGFIQYFAINPYSWATRADITEVCQQKQLLW